MGADLFGSCAESTCAAMVSAPWYAADPNALLYPILITAVGIGESGDKLLIGVKTEEDVAPALRKLLIISSILMAIVMFFVTVAWYPNFELNGEQYTNMGVYWCFLSGLIAGLAVGLLTDYYTSDNYKSSGTGRVLRDSVATNIIFGCLWVTRVPYIRICASRPVFSFPGACRYVWCGDCLSGDVGYPIALMIDAYGPVADNAGGIAEMVGLESAVRERTDILTPLGHSSNGKALLLERPFLSWPYLPLSSQQHQTPGRAYYHESS